MASLDYVEIPPYAIRLQPANARTKSPPRTKPKHITPLPRPDARGIHRPDSPPPGSPTSPRIGTTGLANSLGMNLPAMLLSSAIPAGSIPTDPRAGVTGGPVALLTARDPLSMTITTTHFRRFVPRVGPIFWLQDRVEEIMLWRCGNAYTCAWMAGYVFLCYFPRLILLIPNVVLIAVLLSNYPKENAAQPTDTPAPILPPLPREGSTDWLANIQAIQNLMGAYSDFYDFVVPRLAPVLGHTSQSRPLLLLALFTTLGALPALSFIPLRPVALVSGLLPITLLHPFSRARLPLLILSLHALLIQKRLPERLTRWQDDDALPDAAWRAPMREVALFENERRAPGTPAQHQPASPTLSLDDARMFLPEPGAIVVPATEGSWSKAHLRHGERAGWTRGADGWSGVGDGQVSSNLTFALDDGWCFVETEDWRPDLTGLWLGCGCDEFGWVYTNDAWQDPRPMPAEEWRHSGATRRRRWTRRIYFPESQQVKA